MEGQEAKGRVCLFASPGSGSRSASTFLPQQCLYLLPNMGLRGRRRGGKERGWRGLRRTQDIGVDGLGG